MQQMVRKLISKLKICHKTRDHKFIKNEFCEYSYVRSIFHSVFPVPLTNSIIKYY